jgi:hypothetical protein
MARIDWNPLIVACKILDSKAIYHRIIGEVALIYYQQRSDRRDDFVGSLLPPRAPSI